MKAIAWRMSMQQMAGWMSRLATDVSPWRRMQAMIHAVFAQVAELGVFFIAAAALVAGALALR